MFDIGWSELLLVLVVALVVVGPKDLPRLMRMAGRWVGKARAMADQFRASFDEMARESELDDLRAEIEALRRANPLSSLQQDLNRSIQPPDAAKPLTPSPPPAPGDAPAIDPASQAELVEAAHEGLPETHHTPIPPGSDPPAP